MILNKISNLGENQAYYDFFKKGITENYKKYILELTIVLSQENIKHLTVKCEKIKQIDFHPESIIIFSTDGNSALLNYTSVKYLKLLHIKEEY